MQQDSKAKYQHEIHTARIPGRGQILDAIQRQLAAMCAHQPRQQHLFFTRETRHVRVLKQISTVTVIATVGHVQPDLVQPAGPGQDKFRQWILQLPAFLHLRQQFERRLFHARGLRQVDVITQLH
jgi:hypothetical protein